jgi:XTP/dITP diphosphohydrolase
VSFADPVFKKPTLDPVFVSEGSEKTFAEMPLDEKNLVSHRARAFEKLRQFLLNNPGADNKGII